MPLDESVPRVSVFVMHNIHLTSLRAGHLAGRTLAENAWRTQIPFAVLVLAALSLAWLA